MSYLPSSPLFFFQHWHTSHAILTSFLFSQFFWNILFSTVNSFGEVPCWSSTVYMLTVSLPAAEDLHHTTFSRTSFIKNFEFLSLRNLSFCSLADIYATLILIILLSSLLNCPRFHSLKSKVAVLLIHSSINTSLTAAHVLWAHIIS